MNGSWEFQITRSHNHTGSLILASSRHAEIDSHGRWVLDTKGLRRGGAGGHVDKRPSWTRRVCEGGAGYTNVDGCQNTDHTYPEPLV